MFQKLQNKGDWLKHKPEHLIMPLLKCGKIKLTTFDLIFGPSGVYCMR